jgi:hypothetical protein
MLTTDVVLDLPRKGRNENGLHHNLMDWVKRLDEYDDELIGKVMAQGRLRPAARRLRLASCGRSRALQ